MARLIPKIEIDDISVRSERDTARALVSQLSNDSIIYHSYPWLRTDRNDKGNTTIKEGETDFVIVVPGHGMLILEVKGGDIVYDENRQEWFRRLESGKLKPIQDPFEQARRNTHFLEEAIKKSGYPGAEQLPFCYGYAVVFPDCDYQGSTPAGAVPAIIFSNADLPFLDRRITAALNQWSRQYKPRPIDSNDIEKITKGISASFDLIPVLFRKIEDQEEKLFRLTTEQRNLLGFLGSKSRACIEGVAGSGKTMLAQAQAEKFSAAGKTTLLVCFNKTLAKWISDSISDEYRELITVRHFHGLCAEWVRRAGLKFAPPQGDSKEFWHNEAANLLLDGIDLVPDRFDAVIVDEGQDFHPNWWLPLEMINACEDEGALYVFFDPRQNLYVGQSSSLPALGEPYTLQTNCRNTKSIAKKCGEILDFDIVTHEYSPIGDEPLVIVLDSPTDILLRVQQILRDWIKKGKLKPAQIAILCPTTKKLSSCRGLGKVGDVEVNEDVDAWRSGATILFSTIRNFKGLEADAVILIDVPQGGRSEYFETSDYYVACSRAKHLLLVIEKTF
ncbi:MAG: NERD domain-containing protein [Porticoccaceae bacterium]|nr:NERD domain-containing protein [Porticoccaceae bacterium]